MPEATQAFIFKWNIKSQVTDVVCSHAAFTSLILTPIFAN